MLDTFPQSDCLKQHNAYIFWNFPIVQPMQIQVAAAWGPPTSEARWLMAPFLIKRNSNLYIGNSKLENCLCVPVNISQVACQIAYVDCCLEKWKHCSNWSFEAAWEVKGQWKTWTNKRVGSVGICVPGIVCITSNLICLHVCKTKTKRIKRYCPHNVA